MDDLQLFDPGGRDNGWRVPRRPRIQFAGAHYHVFNRGDGRNWFGTPAAAQLFVDCLFATCERMGWRLHAYCLLPDEYDVVLTTLRANLVTGMQGLQSTFRNRRDARSRAVFPMRYRAVVIEPGETLARVVDHVHARPVRNGVVAPEHAALFRWSSYRFFLRDAAARPAALACTDWMKVRELADEPEGWRVYRERLAARLAHPETTDSEAFDGRHRGWAHGSEDFKRQVIERAEPALRARRWTGVEQAGAERNEWWRMLGRAAGAVGFEFSGAAALPKAAPAKIALAAWLRRRTAATNRWLTEQLHMGPADAVSRYVGELHTGQRPEARRIYDQIGEEFAAQAGGGGP